MLDLYAWTTPNGFKISIMLEECGMPYELHLVNIDAGEQRGAQFTALNPYQKIPALVDAQGPGGKPITLFESGAILMYLADKAGKFLPRDERARYETLQWLMFQMGNVGPMFGQAHHFRLYAKEKVPYAIERYTNESARIYRVLNGRLADTAYLAGGEYSIADIATWPWVRRHERHGQRLEDYPHVKRWFDKIGARPAVVAGIEKVEAAKAAL